MLKRSNGTFYWYTLATTIKIQPQGTVDGSCWMDVFVYQPLSKTQWVIATPLRYACHLEPYQGAGTGFDKQYGLVVMGLLGHSPQGFHGIMPFLTTFFSSFRLLKILSDLGIAATGTTRSTQLRKVLKEFSDVFTDVPGQTHLIEHDIQLTSTDPIRKRPYPVPQSMRETMREEVDRMIKAGIIEPSSSPYCSPSVIVSKRDGSNDPIGIALTLDR
ncbi:hypothetical protein RRG08_036416 [Elysia crispata]|uniref:Uncharacterized protein n=1 Tax=Elysia crispata TaxID=231223 RepID=A0AAE0ZKF1_9GAST|nr:hypothetical protein RRG08_036416 [Elysia crispata]